MNLILKDREYQCSICKSMFIFTKGEQEFYLSKGYAEPRRCVACRKVRKKEKKKNRQSLVKSLRAAELINIEVVSAANGSNCKNKESVSASIVSA